MEPTVYVCIGCAGVGKTTFVSSFAKFGNKPVYTVNLDPAVKHLGYTPDLDIRDNISYEGIMKEYQLGPNGAIATCLNMFVAKIDEIVKVLHNKKDHVILIDTPGQIEIFTWSAAGHILLNALQNCFKKIQILYLVDSYTVTDSSEAMVLNLLHACSVLHQHSDRGLIVFNKIDKLEKDRRQVLQRYVTESVEMDDSDYSGEMLKQLDERLRPVWNHLKYVGVSCKTNEGMDRLGSI